MLPRPPDSMSSWYSTVQYCIVQYCILHFGILLLKYISINIVIHFVDDTIILRLYSIVLSIRI